MPNKNELHFTMSYNKLVSLSYQKEAYLRRDETELLARGITPSRIDAIDTLRRIFIAIPTDTTMQALITIATNNRDAKAALLIAAIREVIGIAKNTFGKKSGEVKAFGSTNLLALDTVDLCQLSTLVAERATQYFADMQKHGLNQAMIDTLATLKNETEPLVSLFDAAVGNQQLTTVQRRTAANALFDEISSMCNTAQVYYADRNPAKASDYVIYKTAGKVQQRNGSVKANSTISRKLKGINANSSFNLRVNEGSTLQFYFSKTNGGPASTKSITLASNPTSFETYTAEDLGYNAQTGFICFCIHNHHADATGKYSIKVGG